MARTPQQTHLGNPTILIFDSGIGGLSVSDEIAKALPHCPLVYTADNHAYPYGTQTETALIERIKRVLPVLEAGRWRKNRRNLSSRAVRPNMSSVLTSLLR